MNSAQMQEYERKARESWASLNSAERDVLVALCKHGPLWDGDVPSKQGRDSLCDKRMACRIVLAGPKYGYQAATAYGANVYKWGFVELKKDIVRFLVGDPTLVRPA